MFTEPVYGKRFFDREEILSLLIKRVDALRGGYRQNIAVIGPELCGKSSLVRHFLSNLNDNQVIPIYVDVKDEPFELFANKFIGSLLYYFLKTESKEAREDLEYLVKAARKWAPKTVESVEKIQDRLKKEERDEAYQLLLDLPMLLQQESKKPCLVVLDEFHNLGTFRLDSPFSKLGKKIMVLKDSMFIVVSSSLVKARKILAEKLYMLFGNFETVELEGFGFETARKFIDHRQEKLGLTEERKDFLIGFTEGSPFYLDLIVSKAKELLCEGKQTPQETESPTGQTDKQLIIAAFEELMFKPGGLLNQHFTNLISRLPESRSVDYTAILLAMADNKNKIREMATSLARSSKDISKHLSRLLETDLVLRNGVFYTLKNSMFKFWLKSAYQRRKDSFLYDSDSASVRFTEDLSTVISLYEEKKNLGERVASLFKSFGNEIVELDQKSCMLPAFTHVECKSLPEDGVYITASGRKFWTIHVVNGEATESDVAKFAARCKGTKHKINRKILIGSGGIEMNAKLLAKEEKMWTWDLRSLNLLLELYGKPPVVR